MRSVFFFRFLLPFFSTTLVLVACGGGGGGGSTTGSGSNAELTVVPAVAVMAGSGSGTRIAAQFRDPAAIAADSSGNIYVADSGNNALRRISPAGLVTTLAGDGTAGSSDGARMSARFNNPNGIAVDAMGNVFVADTNNHTVRRISPAGVVTTLAGSAGNAGSSDGTGSAARFNLPNGIAVDGSGVVYVADTGNHTIRKISATGVVTTLAGSAGNSGSVDATGAAARFFSPVGIVVDGSTLYVADTSNNTLRKITADGTVTTLAGSAGNAGNVDASGVAARFNAPYGLAFDGSTLFVADAGNENIRQVTLAGDVTTLAGTGTSGVADGVGTAAAFTAPNAVASAPGGLVYVADTGNHGVRKIVVASKTVTTFAGVTGIPGFADGDRRVALFQDPAGVALDAGGNLFIADTNAAVIRKLTENGELSDWIGIDGAAGYGEGGIATAQLDMPSGMVFDTSGNLVLVDTGNHIVRKILNPASATTIAGTPQISGSQNGVGPTLPGAAQFASPYAVAMDMQGNMYVADKDNNAIRRVSPAGNVTTLAGNADDLPASDDGACILARFYAPQGIAVNAPGTIIYVADTGNNTIRKITRNPGCEVTTLAGDANDFPDLVDATGINARFDTPMGIALDSAGNLVVADFNNGLRSVTPAGVVTTLIPLTDVDGNTVLPNPVAVSSRGGKIAVTAGNYVFVKQP